MFRRTCEVGDEWRIYQAVFSISLSMTQACLALSECTAAKCKIP